MISIMLMKGNACRSKSAIVAEVQHIASMEWVRPLPRIDHNSEQGKACQNAVKTKLRDYLGQEYTDDVLPLYIVVMLAHGNSAALVAENLEAFLGKNDALSFTQW